MTYTAQLTIKKTIKNLAIGLLACAAVASVQAQTQALAQAQTQTQALPPVQNAAPASAQAPAAAPTMAPGLSGVYVGGSIGSTAITDFGSKVGVGGFVGFKFNDNIAVEGGIQNLGSYSVAGEKVSASAFNISVLGSLPINPKISIYGRLGYGTLTAAAKGANEDTNSVLYGVGARYHFSQNLAIRGEYTRLASDTGTFGVGVQYGF
jgi:OmpA-OmpF porin, OOP family